MRSSAISPRKIERRLRDRAPRGRRRSRPRACGKRPPLQSASDRGSSALERLDDRLVGDRPTVDAAALDHARADAADHQAAHALAAARVDQRDDRAHRVAHEVDLLGAEHVEQAPRGRAPCAARHSGQGRAASPSGHGRGRRARSPGARRPASAPTTPVAPSWRWRRPTKPWWSTTAGQPRARLAPLVVGDLEAVPAA